MGVKNTDCWEWSNIPPSLAFYLANSLISILPFNNVISGRLVSGIFGLGNGADYLKLAGKWISRQAAIPVFILLARLPFFFCFTTELFYLNRLLLFFMALALVFLYQLDWQY